MTLIAIIITILYLLLIGSFIYGFDKVPTFQLKDLKPYTKFSVVVAFRNEAENLPDLLNSISKLNYPKELYEVIFVDDASDDGSSEIIRTFQNSNLKIDIIVLENIRESKSPKKDAIKTAISKAKNEWIVTTDADCVLPKYWLDAFDEFIQTEHPEFIVAPVTYSLLDKFLHRFQLLDMLSLQGCGIGSFGIRKPFLCNGANLAYTKTLFEAVGGFEDNQNIASGDDIFLLEKAVNKHPEKVKFLKCEQAIVKTLPQPSFDALISQRVRWASKTSSYRNWFGKITSIIVFLMNGGLIVFGLLALIGIIKMKILIYLLIIKFGLDLLILFKTASFTNQKEVLISFFSAFILYPFFTVYVIFVSVFKGYKWKGRNYVL